MNLEGKKIGLVICGSFCTFDSIIKQITSILETGAEILPIMSENAFNMDTRFGKAEAFQNQIEALTGKKIISTIVDAEKIGPNNLTDLLLVAPCTGNTLAKLCQGITDTAALMAIKSHIRNNKPVCVSISTNDALGFNLENIGKLLNAKNFYFVPFKQDNFSAKPKSMVYKPELIIDTMKLALDNEQIQPILA